jgi:hypothetical protein
MRCDLNNEFFDNFRQASQAAYREGFADYTKEKKDEALNKLDEFIEKAQQKDYPMFKVE